MVLQTLKTHKRILTIAIPDFNGINKMKTSTSVSVFAVRIGALVPNFENSNSHKWLL